MAAKYAILADAAGTTTQTGDINNTKRSIVMNARPWAVMARSKASAINIETESSIFDRSYPAKRRETGIISVVSRIACELRIDSRL